METKIRANGIKNKRVILLVSICLFILGGSVLAILFSNNESNSNVIEIVQDGEVIYEIDLEQAEDETFRIAYGDSYNIVEIKNQHIHISDASCPDHTCIEMGELQKDGMPIVCLPNRLIIQYKESNTDVDTSTY